MKTTAANEIKVITPLTGEVIATVPRTSEQELEKAIASAKNAHMHWREVPVKERVQVMYRFKTILERELKALSGLIHKENGKTRDEAKAEILKGIECVEYAASLPQTAAGEVLEVSRGIECKMTRCPLGVVAGITPFNFPAMVPLWMLPLAISLGNSFILKPSEQTPLASLELERMLLEAGLPDGVFSVVQGEKELAEKLCRHPEIKAVGFVGSTPAAKSVYALAAAHGKRARCMGGAKNHLIVVPDADPELAAGNIASSVTGCAGQRCMAASVLLAVGDVDGIIEKVVDKMRAVKVGKEMGPVISQAAKERISGYIERAAHVLLDGRKLTLPGFHIGPSIIECASPLEEAARDEIFGPLLAIIRVKTLEEAMKIENQNPYGNAAAIYTGSGKAAEYFRRHALSGMLGVNIGVPVPREPFAFGGWGQSAFGDGDITGEGGLHFWSRAQKTTTKWEARHAINWMS